MPGRIRAHCARAKTHWRRAASRSSRIPQCRPSRQHLDHALFAQHGDRFVAVDVLGATIILVPWMREPERAKPHVIGQEIVAMRVALRERSHWLDKIVDNQIPTVLEYTVAFRGNL